MTKERALFILHQRCKNNTEAEEALEFLKKSVTQKSIDCANAEHDVDGCLGYSTDIGGYSYCETCLECPKASINNRDKEKIEHDPCKTCGYEEGSPFCLQYCPYDIEREQEPTIQDTQAESEKYQKAFDDGYANGYAQARFDYEQEPCDDAISREWLMRKATERFYTTNYFNHISAMIEEAPSVTQKSGKWIPVSERLPDKNIEVLATTEWGSITIGEMLDSNDWFIHEGATNAVIDDIRAWMPLPKPYEPQESEEQTE